MVELVLGLYLTVSLQSRLNIMGLFGAQEPVSEDTKQSEFGNFEFPKSQKLWHVEFFRMVLGTKQAHNIKSALQTYS